MQQLTLESIQSDASPKSIQELRRERLARDDHQCSNCGSSDDLQVHHIVPKSVGGVDEVSNLRTLCAGCHSKTHHDQVGFINANHTHSQAEETRWLPSIQTMQHLVSNVNHPLRKVLIMLMAKTAIGSTEVTSLKLGDFYLRDGGVLGTSVVERPQRPFILLPANDNRPGFSERLVDTYIPLDRETVECVKKWLMVRPDSCADEAFVYTNTVKRWGEPLSLSALREKIVQEAKRLDVYQTEGGENLSPTALVQFFRNRFNGQPAVRSYIDGKKNEMPMPLNQIITDYRENIFELDVGV